MRQFKGNSRYALTSTQPKFRPTQRALDWRVRAAFSSVFFAQANSAQMALPRPSRQQVTHAVERLIKQRKRSKGNEYAKIGSTSNIIFSRNWSTKRKMKKVVPVIFVFIIYSLVFISVAYVRQDNLKPSDIAINNAVYWAESFEGRPWFPVIGIANASRSSLIGCADFVTNAYGYPASPHIAALLWDLSVVQHPGDWNAPRGSLVFWGPSPLNGELGHVALSTGNGNIIEAGPEIIIKSTLAKESHYGPYRGWAWPPLTWPGRSDVFKATALTWAIQIGKAMVFTVMSWLIFLIVKNIFAKIKQPHDERGIMEGA